MKKIFAFIGSPLREKSNTFALTRMMLEALASRDSEISYRILTSGHVNINYCRGCWTCMKNGYCPQDEKDDMKMIKASLEEADFIVLGSPVYTINVSGQMKTFFDRLPSWMHTMRLAGKAGCSVVTTAHNGLEEVQQFVSIMLVAMGIKVVEQVGTLGYGPGHLADPEKARVSADLAAETIYPYVTGKQKISSDEYLEMAFNVIREKLSMGREGNLRADYEYWERRGLLDCRSFSEVLEKVAP